MTISINPLVFSSKKLVNSKGQVDAAELSKFLNDLSLWGNQIQALLSPVGLAGIINGNNNLNASALSNVGYYNASQTTTPQTVNANSAALVVVVIGITGAINLNLNITNFGQNAILLLRIGNSSGASRTVTVKMSNPAGNTYGSVYLLGSAAPLDIYNGGSGQAISNGVTWNGIGSWDGNTSSPNIYLMGGAGL
jgi:hypothetical protein